MGRRNGGRGLSIEDMLNLGLALLIEPRGDCLQHWPVNKVFPALFLQCRQKGGRVGAADDWAVIEVIEGEMRQAMNGAVSAAREPYGVEFA